MHAVRDCGRTALRAKANPVCDGQQADTCEGALRRASDGCRGVHSEIGADRVQVPLMRGRALGWPNWRWRPPWCAPDSGQATPGRDRGTPQLPCGWRGRPPGRRPTPAAKAVAGGLHEGGKVRRASRGRIALVSLRKCFSNHYLLLIHYSPFKWKANCGGRDKANVHAECGITQSWEQELELEFGVERHPPFLHFLDQGWEWKSGSTR
nr:hypothetical protein Iba_chr11fCG1190 [Ipomoea batatas]